MQHAQHAFSYILKETCKIVEMQLTTSEGAGIQLLEYKYRLRYRLETEIQAQLHVSTIALYI